MDIRDYVAADGSSPFNAWFSQLDAQAAAKIVVAIIRLEAGNFSNIKGVGSGVLEYRLNYGPGYRIYFAKDGETIVILLAGGTKKRQHKDIESAQQRWADYRARKTGE